ncbi:CheY-like chemotaxis protein [Bradyrhizobium sp. i1.3.1]
MDHEKVNILLVDDQPAKLLAYEVILKELGENLVIASSGREALEVLLKTEIAVILVDVCMPELDGFELAAMIREHPRFQKTAMIFISAIQVSDIDRLRGYEMGAVDYVPVPVVPEVLRAKIKVFAELYRKNARARTAEPGARGPRSRAHGRAGEFHRKAARERRAAQHGDCRRQDGILGLGLGQRRLDVGRRPVPHLRRDAGDLQCHLSQYPGAAAP